MRGGDRLAPPYRTNVRRADQLLPLQSAVLEWYAANGRDLAFRRTRDPWAVLVSEVIAQQTQAARAAEAWERFIEAFPTPSALAAVSPATVIRAWRGLGYNRRAMALREAAIRIVEDHDGRVPDTLEALTALPGVGPYTARAVAAFAYGIRTPVVDTNVRRVLARAVRGQAAAGPARTATDLAEMEAVLPADPARARLVNAGTMELGQTVCTARSPRCEACPLVAVCAWRAAGYPDYAGPRAPVQKRYEGSDRQVRGLVLRELRASDIPMPVEVIAGLWADAAQLARAVEGLLRDGLVKSEGDELRLP
jgi:A/G-specific adenine glycosylase